MKHWLRKQYKEYKGLILFLVLISCFRSTLADWNAVPTGSMQPTIVEGDRILVYKLAYDVRLPFSHISIKKLADPQRGDIVVFDSKVSDLRLVKRVIGVPGDRIYMRDNRLVINGEILSYMPLRQASQPYTELIEQLPGLAHTVRVNQAGSRWSSFSQILIPQDYYLVLGDNRDNSADSRVIGLVPRHEIIGRTRSVIMSLNYDNYYLPRKNRFFRNLDKH